ncbi:MAG: glycosyltransferase family 1 protein [Gammaproteobacteria bacterium]|nr:glycosyltransferase family 1 protein [Gammaproteobacteria bacterium]
MRIAIDMQGAQSESRFRGIGRYSTELVKALIEGNPKDEFILVLNGAFLRTVEPIKEEFRPFNSNTTTVTWFPPTDVVGECFSPSDWRREVAERAREFFIAECEPDLLLITSLFEGYTDPAVITIRKYRPEIVTATIFYDLIPLLNPDIYLDPHPVFKAAYLERIEQLKSSTLIVAISASAEKEAVEELGMDYPFSVNISAGCNDIFKEIDVEPSQHEALKKKFSIKGEFILYTGGSDGRKNLNRLIEAYALLPETTRQSYQLILAGKMPEDNVAAFKSLSKKRGLTAEEVIWTGYVSDGEMVYLYNTCRCFVLPSIHEGFGLPALEALMCGALVIGSKATSIPEVIGYEEALFDPYDVNDIMTKLKSALTDEDFRRRVMEGTLPQKSIFSWKASARKTREIFEALGNPTKTFEAHTSRAMRIMDLIQATRASLPQHDYDAGIDVSEGLSHLLNTTPRRQLFIDISELIQSEHKTGVQRVVRSSLKHLLASPPLGFSIEPVFATSHHGYRYAPPLINGGVPPSATSQKEAKDIIYQAGDLFLAMDMQHYVQLKEKAFYHQMMESQVKVFFFIYDLLPLQFPTYFPDPSLPELHERWLEMIATLDGAICISKSVADEFNGFIKQKGLTPKRDFTNTFIHLGCDIQEKNEVLELNGEEKDFLARLEKRPTFLCVGTIEPRKCQDQILHAFNQLWEEKQDINLVFVGAEGWGHSDLIQSIDHHPEAGTRLFWQKKASDPLLSGIYSAASCLIFASLNEGFGLPIVEASRYGLELILRKTPIFQEVAGDHAFYFEGLEASDLKKAVLQWIDLKNHNAQPQSSDMPRFTWEESTEALKRVLRGMPGAKHQLLIDISALVIHDAGTGIQRVVKNLVDYFLLNPPKGYRIELVYATVSEGYRYARAYRAKKYAEVHETMDDLIEVSPGDIFFGLDMNPDVQPLHADYYQKIRASGVTTCFMIYDLLCHEMPQYFEPAVVETYHQWLDVATSGDAVICISQSVVSSVERWMSESPEVKNPTLSIHWAHLGAEPLQAKTDWERSEKTIDPLPHNQHPTFLMVGTMEPRKGHEQALDAFEILWQKGLKVNLVIMGKRGWLTQSLSKRLEAHQEFNRQLYWFEQADDRMLGKAYSSADCLLAASFGEGFGLPLIEAASFGLPIIARDLPVFHEVAGDYATYFEGQDGRDIALAIEAWLKTSPHDPSRHSGKIIINTWAMCGQKIGGLLTSLVDKPYPSMGIEQSDTDARH